MYTLSVFAVLLALAATSPAALTGEAGDAPALLSAYWGLDNALPRTINRTCPGGANLDGMPVIFSHPIDPASMQPEDFAVETASGDVMTPRCVMLGPAVDAGELRTALLIGEFGDPVENPPLRVAIVGMLLSGSGDPGAPELPAGEALDFSGRQVEVTPLDAGPFIVYAEVVPEAQWTPGRRGRQGQGSGCPADGTTQIVRVT